MKDFYLRFAVFPLHIEAVTLPNDDGTFDVYVNEQLPEERRLRAYQHEVQHILKDHFYSPDPVLKNEVQADREQILQWECKLDGAFFNLAKGFSSSQIDPQDLQLAVETIQRLRQKDVP